MNFLEKLQNLPEGKKKIILWISVIILTLFLFGWYFKNTQKILNTPRTNQLFQEELKIPILQERMKGLFQQLGPKEGKIEEIKGSFKDFLEEAQEQIKEEEKSETEM